MLQLQSIIVGMSFPTYGFAWVLMGVLLLVFVWLILRQRRVGRELRYELEQLAKLKESNVESEFVLKAMRLSTWHLDPKTMKMTFDSDFRDKTSWVAPYNDGQTPSELSQQISPLDIDHVQKALDDLCHGRIESYHQEYRVMVPHSSKYYWEESYATIAERDIEGKPSSIVGTTMRIDDRKTMENALIDARNRAEESDRMKSAFIANMSHEIRTPLNAIIGFTSVLPDITDSDERRQLLDLIHENTQKLLLIINDVMNISRIESGQDKMVLTTFDVSQVLAEHADRFRKELKNGVELLTRFACESQMITTDITRFGEIVKHLLSNAAKFTTAGTITLGYDKPADGHICVWVSDTGKGIAAADQEKVFQRFYKVDEFIPGAGLGLSICRTMAYSMGGTVTVKSELGQGATFTLDIPT